MRVFISSLNLVAVSAYLIPARGLKLKSLSLTIDFDGTGFRISNPRKGTETKDQQQKTYRTEAVSAYLIPARGLKQKIIYNSRED